MKFCMGWLGAALICAAPALGVTYQPDAPGVNGFRTIDKITWKDSKGLDREFFFAKDFPNAIVPGIKGYVTRLTWQPDVSSARIIAEEDPSAINASNSQGWGINVMHMDWRQFGGTHPVFGEGGAATVGKRDGFDFHQAPVLIGAHHLIFRVSFKQYTTLQKATPDDRKWVQVTTDWFIADGLDYVIYAHTIDASAGIETDDTRFLNNTLAPYSLVSPAGWKGTTDWAGGSDAPDGQSFGDFKRFVTNDMHNWTYGGSNSIPFVWQWVTPLSGRGDAEAAFVQTETYTQKNAGEGFAWGQDAQGTHMPVYPDLNGQEAAYQMNFFDSYNSKRMTWATRFGVLYGGYGSTRGYWNHSLAMMMGKYSEHGAADLLRETESIHNGMLQVQALIGTLVSSGDEGSGNATPHVYSPAGYNHVYRTWEARASANTVRLRFDTGSGSYKRPTLVVRNFTASQARVTLNGVPAAVSTTLDDAGDVLWVTMLSTLTGDNTIEVTSTTPSTCTPICTAGVCGSDGCGGTCPCCVPNSNACGADGCGGTRVCAGTAVCLSNGTCCQPNSNTCGPDGCGGARATCPVCTPSCLPNTCGSNGCGGICGCAGGAQCQTNLTCCQPNSNACGPDGCGGTHGACPPSCAAGDGDGDGICDDRDNCRGCWNSAQADADGDGLGDCWLCDWCSGPGTDTDWDGLCDGVDNCPVSWNQSQSDGDHDGIGNACDASP